MHNRGLRSAGFTLIEIVVVLAVIGALVAILAPRAFTYIEDARKAQAQNDVNQIADAIGNFYQSTGLPPYKQSNTTDKIPAHVDGTDYDCLYSSSGLDFSTDEDSTTGDSWSVCYSGTARDTIERHLIENNPGGLGGNYVYKTTGKNKWEGPYLPSINQDPWGKRYLVNIAQMDPADSPAKGAWAISAGPNGLLETAFSQDAGSSITASGDDIIARVK